MILKMCFLMCGFRHWLYGDKVLDRVRADNGDKSKIVRVRGWFPKRCAMEMIEDDNDMQQVDKKRD